MAKPLWNDRLIGCLTGGNSVSDLKIVRKARIFIGEKTMTAKHLVLRAMYVMGLMAGMSLTWVVNVSGHAIHPPIGTPLPDTLIGLNWEFLGLGAVALGYCAAYLGECMFPTSFAKSVLLSVTLALCASAALLAAVPAHAILPCSAFAGAAFARLLQRVPVPLLWFAGTAGPLTIAEFIFRPLLSGQGPPSWLLWLGLTLSCAALRRIVFLFEKLAIQGLPA